MTEDRQHAGPGAVVIFRAVGENTFEQVVVLVHRLALWPHGGRRIWRSARLRQPRFAGSRRLYSKKVAASAANERGQIQHSARPAVANPISSMKFRAVQGTPAAPSRS